MSYGPVVFLKGNVSEGYQAHGPYPSLDIASDEHDGEEGWVMTLVVPNETLVIGPDEHLMNGFGTCCLCGEDEQTIDQPCDRGSL